MTQSNKKNCVIFGVELAREVSQLNTSSLSIFFCFLQLFSHDYQAMLNTKNFPKTALAYSQNTCMIGFTRVFHTI